MYLNALQNSKLRANKYNMTYIFLVIYSIFSGEIRKARVGNRTDL